MTTEQLHSIVAAGAFPGPPAPAELVETHISWVILTPEYAFKMKKPVAFGFLDFSTLEKRRFYCAEEVRLNRRLAPDLYLGILPVAPVGKQLHIGATQAPAVDVAVQMRRLDTALQMDRLLAAGHVKPAQVKHLAAVLAAFHRAVVLHGAIVYHPGGYWADFAELYRFGADLEKHLGAGVGPKMAHWRATVPNFLERHASRLIERVHDGFWVDGHGDLHTRNIFLTRDGPVVFDCIEFNPHFRQSDILNELAFLCMDLEARDHPELGRAFLNAYTAHWEIFPKAEDRRLFDFFRAYRANVRLKVALLELRQHETPDLYEQVRRYWRLMESCLRKITPSG